MTTTYEIVFGLILLGVGLLLVELLIEVWMERWL